MPGEAQSSKFLLSDATIMVGPRADVFDLVPASHSLGLVKSVRAEVTHGFTELTQGLVNSVVYSVNTSIEPMIAGEIYEYTARNLAYGAQLNGDDGFTELETVLTLASEHDDADTAIALGTGLGSNVTAGDFLVLQKDSGDTIAVIKAGTVTTDSVAIASGYGLPTGVVWPVATTKVYRVRKPIKVGQQTDDSLYGVKIVGLLPEGKRPVTMIFPKVRIMKGLSVAFDTQNFSNMPFEFKPYSLIPGDAHYAEFAGNKSFMVLPA